MCLYHRTKRYHFDFIFEVIINSSFHQWVYYYFCVKIAIELTPMAFIFHFTIDCNLI